MDYPALVQGDDGETPNIDNVIDFTALDFEDPTPESASWEEIAPNTYKLHLALRNGEKGDDGDTVLDIDDFTDPLPRQMIVVDEAGTGFELQAQGITQSYWPATINNTPSGNATYTLATIGVGPFTRDCEVSASGQCIFTPTSADTAVDLMVRLGTVGISTPETSGNIIAKGFGPIGLNAAGISTVLSEGPPAGSVSTFNKILAGNTGTLYLRAERRVGTGTFTSSNSTTWFKVRVDFV